MFSESTGESTLRATDIPPTSAAMSDSGDKQFKKVNCFVFWMLKLDHDIHDDPFDPAIIIIEAA